VLHFTIRDPEMELIRAAAHVSDGDIVSGNRVAALLSPSSLSHKHK
jgi:regulator of extracellular matrix RemA (YlzA/DUF370 family)